MSGGMYDEVFPDAPAARTERLFVLAGVDAELDAISIVMETLRELNPSSQRRILDYVERRLLMKTGDERG